MILLGFLVLMWSADRFTDGAAALARNLGISPIIIGLTIVSIGSSAPEIFVSLQAAVSDNPDVAIGNALGSNITNIALVLGLTAIVTPLTVQSKLIKREYPILLVITLVATWMLYDLNLIFWESLLLIISLFVYLIWVVLMGIKSRQDKMIQETIAEIPDNLSIQKASFYLILGMILLPISADILVEHVTHVAKYFNISDVAISATVVALGTSLPELAATLSSALKKEHEMAIGNIIGSNIFNLLAVLSIPGLFAPLYFYDKPEIFYLHAITMVGLTLAIIVMSIHVKQTTVTIGRIKGGLLFLCFITWVSLVIINENQGLSWIPTHTSKNNS